MAITSTSIVNQAIQLIGTPQSPVTGAAPNFDDSPAGKAAAQLYGPCVNTVARQFGWDFSRNTVDLVQTGNAPPFPYTEEYFYPAGVQVRQLSPKGLDDPNNPLPIKWVVANTTVGGNPAKVIHTTLASAQVIFTNTPLESLWDPLFQEAVVRLLASELAMALSAKPETANNSLEQANGFKQIGEERRN